jgi:hypothetical protein
MAFNGSNSRSGSKIIPGDLKRADRLFFQVQKQQVSAALRRSESASQRMA